MIPDDTFLGFGGGVNGTAAPDATIEYDENGTDELRFAGSNVKFTSSKVTVDAVSYTHLTLPTSSQV